MITFVISLAALALAMALSFAAGVLVGRQMRRGAPAPAPVRNEVGALQRLATLGAPQVFYERAKDNTPKGRRDRP